MSAPELNVQQEKVTPGAYSGAEDASRPSKKDKEDCHKTKQKTRLSSRAEQCSVYSQAGRRFNYSKSAETKRKSVLSDSCGVK